MKVHFLIAFLSVIAINLILGQTIKTIRLDEAYNKQIDITTSDFFESITYIPLETSTECLIDARPKINLTNDYIIITNNTKCLLFDKSSGRFIYEIGRNGRGPGEYKTARGGFFNDITLNLYFQGWKGNLIKYSLDGKVTGSIPIPNFKDNFTDPFFPENYNYLGKDTIACNIFNNLGTQKILIMIFDEKGNQTGSVPNSDITKEHKLSVSTGELSFFHFNNKLFYFQRFNDTVFCLTSNKSEPYLILKRGRYLPERNSKNTNAENISIIDYFESQRFVCLNLSVNLKSIFALYDKTDSELKATEITSGVINNTDSFLPFKPTAIHKEELVGIVHCVDLLRWFENNPDLKIKLPENLKQLGSKQATDNPVIVIANLKN
jgi:hypothetical protein